MKPVVVYTANPCPYCRNAKALLQSRGIPFREEQISWDDSAAWEALRQRSGMRTVPQIFVGDRCIGGYTELAALDASGELTKILA